MEEILMATRWQDVLIGSGQLLFLLALVPALRSERKPPPETCWFTGLTLLAMVVPYAAAGLWWSASMTGACGLAWAALAAQQLPARVWTYLCYAEPEPLLEDVPLHALMGGSRDCARCCPAPRGTCWRADCPRWENEGPAAFRGKP